jgi:major membrane immunogen (membrane-anchored lipoprotein)
MLAVLAVACAGTALAAAPTLAIESPHNGIFSKDQSLPFSGSTNDPLNAVTLAIYAGPDAVGTAVQTVTLLAPVELGPLEGTWEIAPETPLAQGQYTAVAEQTNAEAETGTSAPVTFTIDTTPPAVSIEQVPTPTKDAEPTLTGGAGVETGDEALVFVTIYKGASVGGSVAASEDLVPSGAAWSYKAPHLSDGIYTAQAVQSDEAGNVGRSAAVTFTVDTTPPAVTIHALASPTKNATPTLSGAAGTASGDKAAVTVTIYDGTVVGGTVAQSAIVTASGAEWSDKATHLLDGTYTAQAEQSDEAGNLGKSAAMTFTVDTTPPAVTIHALASPTKNATPTLSGAAGVASGDEAAVTVTIYKGKGTTGKVAVSGAAVVNGAEWSYKATHLADGIYTAQAEQSDEAGNVGKSAEMTFTVDTTPPAVTLDAVPTPTNNPEPTLTGAAGIATGDDPVVSVKIYNGPSVGGTIAASGGATVTGATWSYKAPHLSDGTYTAQAEQSDDAGNKGTSGAVTFTVDTAAPTVTMNPVTSPTNDSTPTLSGTAGVAAVDHPTVTVTIHEGSLTGKVVASGGAPVSSGTGAWSYESPHLTDGTYTAQAAQSDEAGNVGTSSAVSFTVDTTPPAVTMNPVPSTTNNPEPTLTGAAGTATGDDAAVTVTIYKGPAVGGTIAASGGATVTGATWSYKAPHLSEGTYTAQAEQSDDAGNKGASGAVTFTVDTTAPVVSIVALPAYTNNAEPTLTGVAGVATGDDPAVTVKIYEGTSASGTVAASGAAAVSGASWSYKAAHLTDGVYTAQAEQSDDAGNVGKSAATTFTVDTVPPAVTVNPVTSPTNDATPTLTGNAGVATGDRASVTVTIYKGSTASGEVVSSGSASVSGATWSYKSAHLADGKYTAQATQSDEAGNTGKSGEVKFTVDTTPPAVSINAPAKPLGTSEPTLTGDAGEAEGDDSSVTVTIYEGKTVEGKPVASGSVPASAGAWSYKAPHLADGTYTAQAAQGDDAGNVGTSAVTFKTPPAVAVTSPAGGVNVSTPTIYGTAGSATGDSPTITLKIYKGESTSGTLVQTADIANEAGHWTGGGSILPLANGPYTVQAEQSDSYGNISVSSAVKLTVTAVVTIDPSSFVKLDGQLVTNATPSFDGTAGTAPGEGPVHVSVYSGSAASGVPVWQTKVEPTSTGTWTVGPTTTLVGGATYTVQAEQEDPEITYLAHVTFTVDATVPTVTLTSPTNGSTAAATSQTVSGSAGTEAGDLETVTVHLYAGSEASGTPLQTTGVNVEQADGHWSATFGGLSPGTYTAEAEQSDDVGNVGRSQPMTFSLTAPPIPQTVAQPSPPVASFRWVPTAPHPGEPVTLISTSTDPSSAITGFAWAPLGNEAFSTGESALTTTFSSAGAHLVQLRVTAANGLSSTAAETIDVTAPAPALIQPFPIVRMAGSYDAAGVKISLLTVQAPVGATVAVTCRGAGCPAKSESVVASSGPKGNKAGTVVVTLRRFERPLRAGTILEIEVSDHGEIGKFTKFVIHHDKLPSRQDLCLNPAGTTPILCPS